MSDELIEFTYDDGKVSLVRGQLFQTGPKRPKLIFMAYRVVGDRAWIEAMDRNRASRCLPPSDVWKVDKKVEPVAPPIARAEPKKPAPVKRKRVRR